MIFFLMIAAFVFLVYSFVILFAAYKIKPSSKINYSSDSEAILSYSIIIPFRNEIENLKSIFSDLKKINFDSNRFDFIFIDDQTTDGSFERLQGNEFPENFSLIKALKKGKKQAIIQAVSLATGIYIYTVDADCRLHKDQLIEIDQTLHLNSAKLLVQPVISPEGNNLLNKFQFYDYLSLMGINAVAHRLYKSPALASGANLVFSKEAFINLMPFENNMHISSGDDMFLLQSFLNTDPQSIALNYSSTSLVTTQPEKSWSSLFKQRIRWAGKMKRFSGSSSFLLGALSVVVQLVLIGFFVLGTCYRLDYLVVFFVIWFLKSFMDFWFLRKSH